MKNLTTFLLIALLGMPAAFAAPGAHGPDGEHLDAPGGHVHTDAGPRIESANGSFELLGHLQEEELSILIDRYATNEPVLEGKLEVEANGVKVPARFPADHGDHAVDDAQFLKSIAAPGRPALVFTLTAVRGEASTPLPAPSSSSMRVCQELGVTDCVGSTFGLRTGVRRR